MRYCEMTPDKVTFYPEDAGTGERAPQEYNSALANFVTHVTGVTISRLADDGRDAAQNVYIVTEPTNLPTRYQRIASISRSFTGSVNSPAARVVETNVLEEKTIDEVYRIRLDDLERQVAEVSVQGRDVSGLSAGTVPVKTTDAYITLYSLLAANGTFPAATAVKMKDQWERWYALTLADAQVVVDNLGIFHVAAITGTTESHEDGLKARYDAGDRQGLIDYDITTGWPAAPASPTSK